ncbi:hypothetical protein AB2L28_17855 [Kineococcus sp. TBRC 1896]|uniref:Uncharacterized protein n=1 Tax=Kineococcus mangrovi TaxID=1660183 RepID=A0ABV4I5Y6_9ACTN
MFLLVTIVCVALGYAYAWLIERRFDLRDARRWLFLAPVWVTVAVVLLAGARGAGVQGLQSFAFATLVSTVFDVVGRARRRRRRPGVR